MIEVAEGDDREALGRRQHLDGIEEEPRGRAVGERSLVLRRALGAGTGRADVRCLHRLGVPGHRAAFTGDMETHGELAAHEVCRRRIMHERQRHRIAPHRCSRLHRHAVLSAEARRTIRARHQRRSAHLQADMDAVEGHRFGAEDVGEAQAHLAAPQARLHDEPESLVVRSCRRRRKGKFLVRLRRRVADRIGPVRRGDPARDPVFVLLRGSELRQRDQESHHDQACELMHGASSKLLARA